MLNTAKNNIEGDISIEEAKKRIDSYYKENKKQPIKQPIEQPIEEKLLGILDSKSVSSRTKNNIISLYKAFGNEIIFSRVDVMGILGITERPATALIRKMYEIGITEQIIGAGKGKYRFL